MQGFYKGRTIGTPGGGLCFFKVCSADSAKKSLFSSHMKKKKKFSKPMKKMFVQHPPPKGQEKAQYRYQGCLLPLLSNSHWTRSFIFNRHAWCDNMLTHRTNFAKPKCDCPSALFCPCEFNIGGGGNVCFMPGGGDILFGSTTREKNYCLVSKKNIVCWERKKHSTPPPRVYRMAAPNDITEFSIIMTLGSLHNIQRPRQSGYILRLDLVSV